MLRTDEMTSPHPSPQVELVYDGDCPNITAARELLLRAFVEAGVAPRWREWLGSDPTSPERVRGFGSPTILVDGKDVGAAAPGEASTCRIYTSRDGRLTGTPELEQVVAALSAAAGLAATNVPVDATLPASACATPGSAPVARRLRMNLAMLPGIGTALLPKVACPACWPAYAGFLSSIGLGFLLDATYLLPLTATFLFIAIATLAYRASTRRGYGPFVVGVAAAATVLVGKFHFESNGAMYAGLAVLVGASLWNTWPRPRTEAACPACVGNASNAATS